MAPPRTAELWPAIVARLSTARMATILGGTGRIVLSGSNAAIPWSEGQPGGRLVVQPVVRGYPVAWQSGLPRLTRFQVIAEFNDYTAPGYVLDVPMQAAQRLAFELLQWWTPAANAYTRVMVASPIELDVPWQDAPELDREGTEGLVYLSATYRLSVADPPS